MVSSGGVRDLFAPPRTIAAASGKPSVLLLRSAEELGEYPVTVVHSLRGLGHRFTQLSLGSRAGPGWLAHGQLRAHRRCG